MVTTHNRTGRNGDTIRHLKVDSYEFAFLTCKIVSRVLEFRRVNFAILVKRVNLQEGT